MKIRLIGPRNNLGVGVHFSNFADAVRKLSGIGSLIEEVDSRSQEDMLAAAARSRVGDINICFVSINLQPYFRGTNIQWIVFESTRVPEIVMDTMLVSDLVWVPSEWGRDILINNGMDPKLVDVVPEGVSIELYHPYYKKPVKSALRFLALGKYEERKSHTETIIAWTKAFGNDPGVELVIKTGHFVNIETKKQSLNDFLKQLGATNVYPVWDEIDTNTIVNLYRSSDVFVLPTKGEAWGLPIIESAAMGLPIVTTIYSGQEEYLKQIKNSVIPVDYTLGPIECPEFQYFYPTKDGNFGSWAIPDISSIANGLKNARSNIDVLRKNAINNAEIIREKYSWARCADCVVKTLQSRGFLG